MYHFTAQSGTCIHRVESQSPTLFISLWIILFQHEKIKCVNGALLYLTCSLSLCIKSKMREKGEKGREKEWKVKMCVCTSERTIFKLEMCLLLPLPVCSLISMCVHSACYKPNGGVCPVHSMEDLMLFLNSARWT